METSSIDYCHTVEGECTDIDMEGLMIKSKNRSDPIKIQEIMSVMEERTYTLEQALERVIGFYGKYVPFS